MQIDGECLNMDDYSGEGETDEFTAEVGCFVGSLLGRTCRKHRVCVCQTELREPELVFSLLNCRG